MGEARQVPRVAVVMSTYNGADHVEEQIESVLAQDVDVSLYVRDDGSTDGTAGILERYAQAGKLSYARGENVGVVASFLSALAMAPRDIPYVALCDQDDVWREGKLRRAVELLDVKNGKIPQLYCSEYYFCDSQLNVQEKSHLNCIGVGFATMLYETKVSGNTVVMNRALIDEILAAGVQDVYRHDWWIGLVATALGELSFDDWPSLYYRRTGVNASPTGNTGLSLLAFRLKTFLKDSELSQITRQLNRIHELYAPFLSEGDRVLLDRMLRGGRVKKATTSVRLRQKPLEELALRALFLAGKL